MSSLSKSQLLIPKYSQVANSMEGSTQADGENYNREMFDANISARDLADSYLPPFRACIEKGNVSGLMCR